MADETEERNLLIKAWELNWTHIEITKSWKNRINSKGKGSLRLSCIADLMIQFSLELAGTTNYFQSYTLSAIQSKLFPTVDVLDALCKIQHLQEAVVTNTMLEFFEATLKVTHCNEACTNGLQLAHALSKAVYWLLGSVVSLLRLPISPQNVVEIQNTKASISKCHQLVGNLINSSWIQDLVLIGKLSLKDMESNLQFQLSEIAQLQNSASAGQTLKTHFHDEIVTLMKQATKMHGLSAAVNLQNRPVGHIPCSSLQALVDYLVLELLHEDSGTHAQLFNAVLRIENLPVDQLYVDLLHCGYQGLLSAKDLLNQYYWASFVFAKIPLVLGHLEQMYKESGLERSVFMTSCKQLLRFSSLLNDLDSRMRCQTYNLFLDQCQKNNLLDNKKVETLKANRASDGISLLDHQQMKHEAIEHFLAAGNTVAEHCKILSQPWMENKDAIQKCLKSLTYYNDLEKLLISASGVDQITPLIGAMLRLNENTRHPNGKTEDANTADIRADIFNLSFLVLSCTCVITGFKTFSRFNQESSTFFARWRRGLMTHKPLLPSNIALDNVLEQTITTPTNMPISSMAKWDDMVCCSAKVIREIAQAVGSRSIALEILQHVCDSFRNKRPAMCAASSILLCLSFKSMNQIERERSIKILRLFKRSNQQQHPQKVELISRVIDEFTAPIGVRNLTNTPPSKDIDFSPEVLQESKFFDSYLPINDESFFTATTMSKLKHRLDVLGTELFCQGIVMSILSCGTTDSARKYEDFGACLSMLEPYRITPILLSHTLVNLIHGSHHPLLADPHGSMLASFVSKALAYTFIVGKESTKSSSNCSPRPAKMMKLERNTEHDESVPGIVAILRSSLEQFIDAASTVLSTKEYGPRFVFVVNLLECLAPVCLHLCSSLRVNPVTANKICDIISHKVSRNVLLFLCDIETKEGKERMANALCDNLTTS